MPEAGSQRPAERRGPIFIIGAMGSGTTLLRLMLDSHENIAIPRETGFMRAFNAQKFIPFKWSGRNWFKRLGWTEEEWEEHLRGFYDTAFSKLLDKHGKTRWGDKTPYHTWHIDDMARVFPDAQFVGMLRHPGGSVASNVTRWDPEKNPRFGYTLPRAIHHYQRYAIEIARKSVAYPDRFTVVRYEDLVLKPEPAMRELLDWLGEPWDEQVLKHHEVQASRGGKKQVEGRVKVDEPIDTSRITKWTNTIGPKGRRRLKRRVGRIGEFWGYDVDRPEAVNAVGSPDRLLITPEDVQAQMKAMPDIDFGKDPHVPLADRLFHPGELKLEHAYPQKQEEELQQTAQQSRFRRIALPVFRRLPAPLRRRILGAARKRWERGSGLTPSSPPSGRG